jgi:plastocyanin
MKRLSLLVSLALALACSGEEAKKPAPRHSTDPKETPSAPKPTPETPAKVSSTAPGYEVIALTEKGSLQGAVTWSGDLPKLAPLAVDKDTDTCGKEKQNPRLVIDPASKGVANAVVFLENVTKGADLSPKEATLDQKSCVYEPHVQIIPRGSKITYLNSDPTLHNVHGYLGEDSAFNLAMPTAGMKLTKELKKPGFLSLKCDAGHVWMSAYLVVVEHPYYALTDAQGRYEIKDIPPGKYQVKMWHEGWETTLNEGAITYSKPVEVSREAEIAKDAAATLNFELPAK